METLLQDIRFGLRSMLKTPGFTLVAIFTLALGIGATSSIFSVVNAVLLSSLPYPDAEELVIVRSVKTDGPEVQDWPIGHLDFTDWQLQNEVFDELAVHTQLRSYTLVTDGEPERIQGEMMSWNLFALLGVQPARGRLFTEEEDTMPGPHRVMMLSYDFWQSRFGGDEDLINNTLILEDESYQVIGVMPPGFKGMTDGAQIFLPVTLAAHMYMEPYITLRPFRWLNAVARMKDGVSVTQAQANMDSVTRALAEQNPQFNTGIGVQLDPLSDSWRGGLRGALWTLLAGAGLVLLIACTNIANLLLARATARQREIALRAAVGAGRGRLIRQLLTESILLSIVGCILGLVLSTLLTSRLVALSDVDLRGFMDPSTDRMVVLVIIGIALLCGIGFGLAPALLSSRANLQAVLKEGTKSSGGSGQHLLQNSLVVTQVVLALLLCLGAGLLFKSFQDLRNTDLGFQPQNLFTARVDVKAKKYEAPPARVELAQRLAQELSQIPGISELALTGPDMPTDPWNSSQFTIEGQEENGPIEIPYHTVTPGYFSTLGIKKIDGRDFGPQDAGPSPQPPVVISERLAKLLWPNDNARGKRLKFGGPESGAPWMSVEGIVGHVRHEGFRGDERPAPDLYIAMFQFPPNTPPQINILARPEGDRDALQLQAPLREALRTIAPDLPLFDTRTMSDRLDEQVTSDRFLVLLMTVFAGLAVLLAAIGIYGVISYTVTQRTREIGIRMAMGADSGRILKLVVGRALTLAGIGIVIGLTFAGATLGSSDIQRLLDRSPLPISTESLLDPVLLGAGISVLLLIALAASLVPALRAIRIEPSITLRQE